MDARPKLLERAFQLARSGEFRGTAAIVRKLNSEGYLNASDHLSGRGVRLQLKRLWDHAEAPAERPHGKKPV